MVSTYPFTSGSTSSPWWALLLPTLPVNSFTFPSICNEDTSHQSNLTNPKNAWKRWCHKRAERPFSHGRPKRQQSEGQYPILTKRWSTILKHFSRWSHSASKGFGTVSGKRSLQKQPRKRAKAHHRHHRQQQSGKTSLWSSRDYKFIRIIVAYGYLPALHTSTDKCGSLESTFPYLRSIIHHLTHPLQMVHIRRLDIQIRNNNSCAFRRSYTPLAKPLQLLNNNCLESTRPW